MRKLTQKYRHDPENGVYGDCHRACIAMILDLDIEAVPHFAEDNPAPNIFWHRVEDFLSRYNLYTYSQVYSGVEPKDVMFSVGALNAPRQPIYVLGGKSKRGTLHSVVCVGSELFHDPHPDGGGIVAPDAEGYLWVNLLVPREYGK